MNPDEYQKKALKSWQFGNDLIHVSGKLAGEAGEVLDGYLKSIYKPGYKEDIQEYGDYWFYWRLCAYYLDYSCYDIGKDWTLDDIDFNSTFTILSKLQMSSAKVFDAVLNGHKDIAIYYLGEALIWLSARLAEIDLNLDELTELNYKKLNSESSHHGWKKPFEVFIPSLPPGINTTYHTTKNGVFYKSEQAKEWQDKASKIIGAKVGEMDIDFLPGADYLFEIDFYFQRPNADIDRSIKLLLDTFSQKLGFDDKHVMEVRLKKHVKEGKSGVNVIVKVLS